MAAFMPKDLATASAQGDLRAVQTLISNGADVSQKSKDGMTPLSIAAFWGYADIAKSLLKSGADINGQNKGTNWTPVHCAAFQGHGPVLLHLLQYKPDLCLKDYRGRTASDFASALDSIWPLFAAHGIKRTSKSELIKMDIVQKVTSEEVGRYEPSDMAHFSRPGSAYAMRPPMPVMRDPQMEVAAITGDVLAATPEEPEFTPAHTSRSLLVWDN